MARLLVTVIADDLTGAADSAAPFAAAGLATWVFLELDRGQRDVSVAVAAFDTDSRNAGVDVAVARSRAAAEAVLRGGCRVLYKKIDSTLRGHVGPEVAAVFAAAVEASPPDARPVVLMSPAFPATGRVVRSGRVMVDGAPLERAPAALLAEAGLAVSTVGSATDLGGGAALRSAIEEIAASGVDAIVCDAVSEDDLRAIAEAGTRVSRPVMWAGSGGLAHHLPRALGLTAEVGPSHDSGLDGLPSSGPTLVLVGSRAPVAQRQAAALARDANVETIALEPATLLAGANHSSWRDASAQIDRVLRSGRDVAIAISPEPAVAVADGADRHLAVALSRLAATHAPIGTLFATGGDTARAALQARGIGAYRLVGVLEAGVALGIVTPGDGPPLRIVTKAGGFGTDDTLVRGCASLRAPAARSLAT